MILRFTCKVCGVTDVPFEIAERGSKEPLSQWMGLVRKMVGMAHTQVSPHCQYKAVDLKIPIPANSTGKVGQATKGHG